MLPRNPSIGSLSIHLPTIDIDCIISASSNSILSCLEVYWRNGSEYVPHCSGITEVGFAGINCHLSQRSRRALPFLVSSLLWKKAQ